MFWILRNWTCPCWSTSRTWLKEPRGLQSLYRRSHGTLVQECPGRRVQSTVRSWRSPGAPSEPRPTRVGTSAPRGPSAWRHSPRLLSWTRAAWSVLRRPNSGYSTESHSYRYAAQSMQSTGLTKLESWSWQKIYSLRFLNEEKAKTNYFYCLFFDQHLFGMKLVNGTVPNSTIMILRWMGRNCGFSRRRVYGGCNRGKSTNDLMVRE